ncbi:MAG: hypothetical protein AAGB12_04745 [Pseudomonadota bacterium]
MKPFVYLSFLFFVTTAVAETPQIGDSTFRVVELECPAENNCTSIDQSFCSQENVQISTNDNGTFDIVFNDFNVTTSDAFNIASGSCVLNLPIQIDNDQRVALKEVSIAGVTLVNDNNRTSAGITHFFGGRESTRIETFDTSQAFTVTHAQELSSQYSNCGSNNVFIGTRVDITASRDMSEIQHPFINLSSGSGKIQYVLDYQTCDPNASNCAEDQVEVNQFCYNLGDSCRDYIFTNKDVCTNDTDELTCYWSPSDLNCVEQCDENQYEHNGSCYNLATQCAEYNNTSPLVCNNGQDDIQCDWIPEADSTPANLASTCVSTCPDGMESIEGMCQIIVDTCPEETSFEIDGICYPKDGSCSQYNATNPQLCNTNKDNLSCDWIENHSNVTLEKTCVASCPQGYIELDGICYEEQGSCTQYNNTDSDTCNNGKDDLKCDWIPAANTDLPELANTCTDTCPAGMESDGDVCQVIDNSCPAETSFEVDGVCYPKDGSCSQYNDTNAGLCNTNKDNLSCDWIENHSNATLEKTCVTQCPEGAFELDGICYETEGSCSQYDGTSSDTCNNTDDELSCDWMPVNYETGFEANLCVSECPSGSVVVDGNCYQRYGSCSQYNNTNDDTCNNGEDSLYCNWDSDTKICSNECDADNAVKIDGICYPRNGSCSQYTNTDSDTCNNGEDTIHCDWDSQTQICSADCGSDSTFEVDGVCYQKEGMCSQYNGTSSSLCNSGKDSLYCDWDSAEKICYSE